MSEASTSPAPPAIAGPLTAAMIGLGNRSMYSTRSRYAAASACHSSAAFGSLLVSCISPRSMPAQNTVPAPVSTTARTRVL